MPSLRIFCFTKDRYLLDQEKPDSDESLEQWRITEFLIARGYICQTSPRYLPLQDLDAFLGMNDPVRFL